MFLRQFAVAFKVTTCYNIVKLVEKAVCHLVMIFQTCWLAGGVSGQHEIRSVGGPRCAALIQFGHHKRLGFSSKSLSFHIIPM